MKKFKSIVLLVLIFASVIAPRHVHADEIAPALPPDNLLYPVIIQVGEGTNKADLGSGFFVDSSRAIYLVTAKHVLYHQEDKNWVLNGKIAMMQAYTRDLNYDIFVLDLQELQKDNAITLHSNQDLVVVRMGRLVQEGSVNSIEISKGIEVKGDMSSGLVGVDVNNLKTVQDVHVGNDVFIFGYPTSLQNPSLGIDFRKPLLSKGIIAGVDASSKKIILDAPVFFGNSGGLVIEAGANATNALQREYRPVGMILGIVPFINEFKNQQYGYSNFEVENSGYSIALPMDFLIELIAQAESR